MRPTTGKTSVLSALGRGTGEPERQIRARRRGTEARSLGEEYVSQVTAPSPDGIGLHVAEIESRVAIYREHQTRQTWTERSPSPVDDALGSLGLVLPAVSGIVHVALILD